MADYKSIAGRIKSEAFDGVSVEAQEVLDISKNKKQSQINAETDTTLANHASAIQGLNSQNYETYAATDQTTAETDVLPPDGSEDTIYRLGNWDGVQYDVTCYSEYSWNGSAYVHISTKSQIGEVFDISAYHATGGTLAAYSDLNDALNGVNGGVPQSLRRGGMQISFVHTSDNKYVQYRCIANEFTTDTTQWAICSDTILVENPEFVDVKLDAKKRILWAINRKDGTVHFGAGVPPQIVEYIQIKLAELSLDEYEGIVAFLDDIWQGDKTLQQLLDEKLNKEGLDSEALNSFRMGENPEFIDVKTDNNKRIFESTDKGGNKTFYTNVKVLGTHEVNGAKYFVVSNPEWLAAWIADGKIIFGFSRNGKTVVGDAAFLDEIENIKNILNDVIDVNAIDWDALTALKTSENPEFINLELDNEKRILGGRKYDGTKFENLGFETNRLMIDGTSFNNVDDPEGRIEIKTDSKKKVVSYRDKDGTLHEESGLITPAVGTKEVNTDLFKTSEVVINSEKGKTELKQTLDASIPVKNPNLPKNGHVVIAQETFYLTANSSYSSRHDIVLIQILPDTNANAAAYKTLSYFFVLDNTLTGTGSDGNTYTGDLVTRINNKCYVIASLNDGQVVDTSIEVTFDSNSVSNESIRLDLFPGKEVGQTFGIGTDGKTYYTSEVTKVGSTYYVTKSLDDGEVTPESIVVTESKTKEYYVKKLSKVGDDYFLKNTLDGGGTQQVVYNGETINGKPVVKVTQITDVPPYMAWCVNKNLEHYCAGNIDFGDYYTKTNTPFSIKFQGSGSLGHRKRGLRLTPYKKADYAKKNKIKIGEMIRLSGYNMKSYFTDVTRIMGAIIADIGIEIYDNRGEASYPWYKNGVPNNGVTGMIKSFPIETSFGSDFFGIQIFGLKKDEKNYMLDSADDASGIFVSGDVRPIDNTWTNASPRDWEDEFDADNKVPAYDDLPNGRASVSVETAAAMTELFKYITGFITGSIEIEGQTVDFENSMLEERIDLGTWIDYYICLQVFQLYDSTYHNMILYTGSDKKKFYVYMYDLDVALKDSYDFDILTDDIHANRGPLDFWVKFVDTYKDSIYNRYVELRKNILSDNNILAIYNKYLDNIPQRWIDREVAKWGNGDPRKFKDLLDMLKRRLAWLDSTFFDIDKFN